MTAYFLINPQNEIINRVLADSPELALLGCEPGTQAVTELSPEHHEPAPPIVAPAPMSKLEFLRRFTAEERIALRASADPVVVDFMALLDLASEVRTGDRDTVAAMEYMSALGLLAEGRTAEILE